jgi:putative tryptophan/tyrosine transport system substrate-binding protein
MIIKKIKQFIVIAGVISATAWAFLPEWYEFRMPSHPALDEVRVAFIQELKQLGFQDDKTIALHIANESGTLLSVQLMKDFKEKIENKIYIAIGTSIAQVVQKDLKPSEKLVFSSVSDPKGAGLLDTKKNIMGISNYIAALDQLKYFVSLFPQLKVLGVLYNPNEQNSSYIVKDIQKAAKELGLEIKLGTASSPDDVEVVASSLQGVDAIFVNNDNTFASEWGDVVKVSDQMKIPALASDSSLIPFGAAAAYGADSSAVGRATGKLVASLLSENKENEILQNIDQPIRVLNLKKIKELGLSIPTETIDLLVDRKWPEGWLVDLKSWISSFF